MYLMMSLGYKGNIDGLVQDCSNSIANALELLQSCPETAVLPWAIGMESLIAREAWEENLTNFQSSPYGAWPSVPSFTNMV